MSLTSRRNARTKHDLPTGTEDETKKYTLKVKKEILAKNLAVLNDNSVASSNEQKESTHQKALALLNSANAESLHTPKLKLGEHLVSGRALLTFMKDPHTNKPYFDPKQPCNTLSDVTKLIDNKCKALADQDISDEHKQLKIYRLALIGLYALILDFPIENQHYQLPSIDSSRDPFDLSFTLFATLEDLISRPSINQLSQESIVLYTHFLLVMFKASYKIPTNTGAPKAKRDAPALLSSSSATRAESLIKNARIKTGLTKLTATATRLLKRNKATAWLFKEKEKIFAAFNLLNAIHHGNRQEIDKILTQHPEVLNEEICDQAPMLYAISSHSLEICQHLVNRGADVNFSSRITKANLLIHACLSYQVEIVAYLLDQGAKINSKDFPSAIDHFAEYIYRTTSSNQYTDQNTLTELHRRQVLIFQLLFSAKGAYEKDKLLKQFKSMKREDLIACVNAAQTQLHTDTIIDIQNEPQKQNHNPPKKQTQEQKQRKKLKALNAKAQSAAEKGNYEDALNASQRADKIQRQILLRNHRAAFRKAPSQHERRFAIAIENGEINIAITSMDTLIQNGKKKGEIGNMRNNDDETMLIVASKKLAPQFVEIIKFLVEKCQANITLSDKEERTVLHWIAKSNNVTALVYLVSHCPDDLPAIIDQQDSEGKTALHYAVTTADPLIAEILLAQGASFSIEDQTGQTAKQLTANLIITKLFEETERAEAEAQKAKEEAEQEEKAEKERVEAIKKTSVRTPTEAFDLLRSKKLATDDEFATAQARCACVRRKLFSTFREDPNNFRNGILLQKFLKLNREYEKQYDILLQLKAIRPNDPDLALDISYTTIRLRRFDETEATLSAMDSMPALSPHYVQEKLRRQFWLYLQQKNYKKSREIKKILDTFEQKDDFFTRYERAIMLLKSQPIVSKRQHQKYQRIIALFDKTIAEFGQNHNVIRWRAVYNFACNNLDAARNDFLTLEKNDLKHFLLGLARVAEKKGEIKEAQSYFDKAKKQFPHFYPSRFHAIKFEALHHSDDPIKNYQNHLAGLIQLRNDFPKNPEPYLLLAHAYWDHGDYTRTVDAYYELFEAFPEAVSAHIDYVYRELMVGHTQVAISFCERLLPDADEEDNCFSLSPAFYLAYVDALLQDGQEEKAHGIGALCAKKFPSGNEHMQSINDRLGLSAGDALEEKITDDNHVISTKTKSSNTVSKEVKRDTQAPLPSSNASTALTRSNQPANSTILTNVLAIPASIQTYFTQLQRENFTAILDGMTTIKILALKKDKQQQLSILTTASPEFLISQWQVIHVEDNTYQVDTDTEILYFTSLPHLKSTKDLIRHSLEESNFTVFTVATDIQGKIHWTSDAQKAYSAATLSVAETRKTAVDEYFRKNPLKLLTIPELAAQFNFTIDPALKKQVDTHAQALLEATKQSNPPQQIYQLLRTTPVALQQIMASCIATPQGDGYQNNAYDFYIKLLDCGTNMINLIFPSAYTLSEIDHQDIISRLATLKNKHYNNPVEVLNELYTLVATWQNRHSYGTQAFMGNLQAQRVRYGVNLEDVAVTPHMLSQIVYYIRVHHIGSVCMMSTTTMATSQSSTTTGANTSNASTATQLRSSSVASSASVVGPQQLWQSVPATGQHLVVNNNTAQTLYQKRKRM